MLGGEEITWKVLHPQAWQTRTASPSFCVVIHTKKRHFVCQVFFLESLYRENGKKCKRGTRGEGGRGGYRVPIVGLNVPVACVGVNIGLCVARKPPGAS